MSAQPRALDVSSPSLPRIERIELRQVGRSFGATVAVRQVRATLHAGEITVLEGHNGSGKTTLLRMIGTLVSPSSGVVAYAPPPVDRAALRQAIGWLSHDALAYPDLSARQNVHLAARLYGCEPGAAWARALERFGLETFADRPLRFLSRGQRQRVALARSLAHEPSVVLLDEPTTGLDPEGVARLRDVVREERAAGHLVVVVTHEPDWIRPLGPRWLRLDRGRLVDDRPAVAPEVSRETSGDPVAPAESK